MSDFTTFEDIIDLVYYEESTKGTSPTSVTYNAISYSGQVSDPAYDAGIIMLPAKGQRHPNKVQGTTKTAGLDFAYPVINLTFANYGLEQAADDKTLTIYGKRTSPDTKHLILNHCMLDTVSLSASLNAPIYCRTAISCLPWDWEDSAPSGLVLPSALTSDVEIFEQGDVTLDSGNPYITDFSLQVSNNIREHLGAGGTSFIFQRPMEFVAGGTVALLSNGNIWRDKLQAQESFTGTWGTIGGETITIANMTLTQLIERCPFGSEYWEIYKYSATNVTVA